MWAFCGSYWLLEMIVCAWWTDGYATFRYRFVPFLYVDSPKNDFPFE